jgi:cytochrome P450
MQVTYPQSEIDLYSDAALLDPSPLYRQLRDAGPAVWLSKYNMMALARYKDVTEAMRNWQVFSSAQGVMMNQPMNDTLRGIVLCSDDPEHAALRRVIVKPITPLAIISMLRLIWRNTCLSRLYPNSWDFPKRAASVCWIGRPQTFSASDRLTSERPKRSRSSRK